MLPQSLRQFTGTPPFEEGAGEEDLLVDDSETVLFMESSELKSQHNMKNLF